ncbi:MAG TPA: thioredoxin family protein [Gammaproteobacteria bacterium]|jgi:hypothetical protein
MTGVLVQLLSFDGCPLADNARNVLERALADCGMSRYQTIDILDPATPEELRAWGSPTILVNGEDVTGHPQGDGVGCRVYAGPGRVPDMESIVRRIRSAAAGDRGR